TAGGHGIRAVRVPTPSVHPAFVAGLIDLVLERVNDVPQEERPHLTTLGPWPDHATVGEASTVVNEATHGTAGR
ncbi:MAG TPA: hypothetical protein VGO31_02505, partial [Microbacteriaceae bacterium]|nr:hypothetical protein [Microbacteriaceae bacterium]